MMMKIKKKMKNSMKIMKMKWFKVMMIIMRI